MSANPELDDSTLFSICHLLCLFNLASLSCASAEKFSGLLPSWISSYGDRWRTGKCKEGEEPVSSVEKSNSSEQQKMRWYEILRVFRLLGKTELPCVDMNRLKKECGKVMQSHFGTLVNCKTCKPKPSVQWIIFNVWLPELSCPTFMVEGIN